MYDCALMYGPNHLVTPSLNDQWVAVITFPVDMAALGWRSPHISILQPYHVYVLPSKMDSRPINKNSIFFYNSALRPPPPKKRKNKTWVCTPYFFFS